MESNESGEGGFEIVSEFIVPFVNERTDFKAAVVLETYDPDAFLGGGFGAAERNAVINLGTKVADFLGFFQDEAICDLILPEGKLSIED